MIIQIPYTIEYYFSPKYFRLVVFYQIQIVIIKKRNISFTYLKKGLSTWSLTKARAAEKNASKVTKGKQSRESDDEQSVKEIRYTFQDKKGTWDWKKTSPAIPSNFQEEAYQDN